MGDQRLLKYGSCTFYLNASFWKLHFFSISRAEKYFCYYALHFPVLRTTVSEDYGRVDSQVEHRRDDN